MTDNRNTALLVVLHEAFVAVRLFAGNGDASAAYEIADALEDLPARFARGDLVDLQQYGTTYLGDLLESRSELARLKTAWAKLLRSS